MNYDDYEQNAMVELCDEEDSCEVTEQELANVTNMPLSAADPLKMYMKDIAAYPLLSKEEEFELGTQKSQGSDEARERLINCNLRLVVSLAKKKYDQISSVSSLNMSLEDLIQDGNMGLVTAVDRYDASRGIRFATYAAHWINQAIKAGISQHARTIRIPDHKVEAMLLVRRASNELFSVLSRDPLDEEIAAFLNYKLSVKEVRDLQSLICGSSTVSLSTPLGEDDEDGTMEDMIPDSGEGPAEYSQRMSVENALTEAVNALPDKERTVIVMSFGLFGEEKKTLDEIAAVLYAKGYTNRSGEQITKEGVRQLKERALKLMAPKLQGAI